MLRLRANDDRRDWCRGLPAFSIAVLLLLLLPPLCLGQTTRVVVIQCDGLPYDVVDRFVHERDPRTGKSQLPWFDYIFYQRGTRSQTLCARHESVGAVVVNY